MQQHDDPESDINLSADVLFPGHHGSGHGTSEELLDYVDPDVAIISSGLPNSYTSENQYDGHPHDTTLQRLHAHEIEQDPADEQTLTTQRETSTDLSHDENRDLGMGL